MVNFAQTFITVTKWIHESTGMGSVWTLLALVKCFLREEILDLPEAAAPASSHMSCALEHSNELLLLKCAWNRFDLEYMSSTRYTKASEVNEGKRRLDHSISLIGVEGEAFYRNCVF